MEHAAAAGMGFMAVMVLVGIAISILWVVSLIDVLRSDFQGQNTKIIWIVVLLVLAPLGTILYQLIGKKQKV